MDKANKKIKYVEKSTVNQYKKQEIQIQKQHKKKAKEDIIKKQQIVQKMHIKEEKQQKQIKIDKRQKKTNVINVRVFELRKKGYNSLIEWLDNPDHIYIGRYNQHVQGADKSKWANPFKVDEYGRQGCLEQYKKYILSNKNLLNSLSQLKEKTLGCWCKPEGCHGDILVELINKL